MAPQSTPSKQSAPASSNDLQNRVEGLSRLLGLVRGAREAKTLEDIYFLSVNETHRLTDYDQGLIWIDNGFGKAELKAISGISSFDKTTPKINWLHNLAKYLQKNTTSEQLQKIEPSMLPAALAKDNEDYLSAHTLYIPFTINGENLKGGFLFTRGKSWPDNEVKIIEEACRNYVYALSYFHRKPRKLFIKSLFKRAALIITVLAALYILAQPSPMSIIVPMEIKAHNPWIATSPHEGVIKDIHVKPNEPVSAGTLIISLDDTKLRNEVTLAEKDLTTKLSELRQARQQSMAADRTRSGDAKLLELQVEQKRAEIAYLKELLAQTNIYAAEDGIAIFNNPHEWKGRPVHIGERILAIADPQHIEVQILMPVADAIKLNTDKTADLFLNTDPLHPRPAQISRISYQAENFPDGTMAYIVTANITDKAQPPRIGQKGSAKLYGEEVSLFYNIFKRPLAFVKRKLLL